MFYVVLNVMPQTERDSGSDSDVCWILLFYVLFFFYPECLSVLPQPFILIPDIAMLLLLIPQRRTEAPLGMLHSPGRSSVACEIAQSIQPALLLRFLMLPR